jgi:hypothetical protein
MNLIIDAELTEPPSEVSVFRDITLYSNVFLDMDVLLMCQQDMRDLYWYWLKNRGAFDFVDDIISDKSEDGYFMAKNDAHIQIKFLRAETLNFVIQRLQRLKN